MYQNRPFEFRAWHLPTLRMWAVNQANFTRGEVIPELPEGATRKQWEQARSEPLKLSECVLMQFTGLIDPNGAKIFEGDILRFVSTDAQVCVYSRVVYQQGTFIAQAYDADPESMFDACRHAPNDVRYFEYVVGNIYQNPELLPKLQQYSEPIALNPSPTHEQTDRV